MTFAQDRMPPVPKDQWTDSQKKAAAEFAGNRKQEVFGPFAVMLRSPEVMLRAMAMGDYLRFRTVLPPRLREFAVLLTARHWTQQFEWGTHQPAALRAGLEPDIVTAVAEGRRPEGLAEDDAILHDFVTELLHNRSVSDASYAKAVAAFGEQGVVDLVAVAGYYTFLSMMLNTARTPAPLEPTAPPLERFPK